MLMHGRPLVYPVAQNRPVILLAVRPSITLRGMIQALDRADAWFDRERIFLLTIMLLQSWRKHSMPLIKPILNVIATFALIASGSSASAQSRPEPMIAAIPDKGAVLATADSIPTLVSSVPRDLAERMQRGGLVFVHRYTGSESGGPDQQPPDGAIPIADHSNQRQQPKFLHRTS
ncbi:hypothetical protein [Primorskyibacter flagellatus]|uniref:hypothetical protein n=1 Tax=Primorskyibacter flagellatus TaxID=1387277 RepID=UPI003A91CB5F